MWHPEIMYEEDDTGVSSKFPFIPVPGDQKMPEILYIFESRETGEIEHTEDGQEARVIQMDLHQYADMAVLKERLDPAAFDGVRAALGLDPLVSAQAKGEKISQAVRKNLE